MSVAEDITALIAGAARVAVTDIGPETRLEDLGLDSLALVELIFAIEEQFDISVPFNPNDGPEAASGAGFDPASLGSVIASVEALLAKGAGGA